MESDSRTFVFGNYIDEVLIMRLSSGSDFYYAHDHLYSPTVLYGNTGSIVLRYEYDAYGKRNQYTAAWVPSSIQIFGNPFAFTGRELDYLDGGNLDLMHYRARTYDSATGRFMQRDPYQYVDGNNLYEYVSSNPITTQDPLGLFGWKYNGNSRVSESHFEKLIATKLMKMPASDSDYKLLRILFAVLKYNKNKIPIDYLRLQCECEQEKCHFGCWVTRRTVWVPIDDIIQIPISVPDLACGIGKKYRWIQQLSERDIPRTKEGYIKEQFYEGKLFADGFRDYILEEGTDLDWSGDKEVEQITDDFFVRLATHADWDPNVEKEIYAEMCSAKCATLVKK